MMSLPEGFNLSLAEFGRTLDTELAIEDGRCAFTVDGAVEVELDYIDDAHVVVAWATVGHAPEDGYAQARAAALLTLNEPDAPNGGFSLSMDPATRNVVAHDNRPAEFFESADRLAAWIGALVDLVWRVRADFERRFPCDDYEENAEEVVANA